MSRRSPRTGLTRSTEIKRAAETYERNPTRDNLAQLEKVVRYAWRALDGEPPKQAPEGVPPHVQGVLDAREILTRNSRQKIAHFLHTDNIIDSDNAVSHKPE
jgi:hypothetical protein